MTTKKRKVDKVNSDDSSPDHLLLSEEDKEKLKNKHYRNTYFDKIELFISRICYDDNNRLDNFNSSTDWNNYFSKFKEKLKSKLLFQFDEPQSIIIVAEKNDLEDENKSKVEKQKLRKIIIKKYLKYILENTKLLHQDDMKKNININTDDSKSKLEKVKIDENREEYINYVVELFYNKIEKRREDVNWRDDDLKTGFKKLANFLGYIFHLGDNNNYWVPWDLDLSSLKKVNVDINFISGLNKWKFYRDNENEDINFEYLVNYLVIVLYLYNVYYNTRTGVHYRKEESQIITQAWLETFNFENTENTFLANFQANSQNVVSKKINKKMAHVQIKNYYLKHKIYLGNQYDKKYDNLIYKKATPSLTLSNLNPTLTTYNLQEINNTNNNFMKLINNFTHTMYDRNTINRLIKLSPVNLYQEVNRNFLERIVIKNSDINRTQREIIIKLDSELETKSSKCKSFINNNNIVKDPVNDNYTIPCYKFNDKFCVYTTNRLSSFDGKNLNKCNLICSNQEINDNDIFIGKLLDSCIAQWTHTFIAIKNNNNIYINIHLDTDKEKFIPQTELIYLLKHVIPIYDFFKFDKNNKIYIAGDFNLDCIDIIDAINIGVNAVFYTDKIFKVALNNIITHGEIEKGKSLDNCIIIEYRTEQSSSSTPIVGSVPEPVEYNPYIFVSDFKQNENDILPDHGLVILQDIDIDSSIDPNCKTMHENMYINKPDNESTMIAGSKKNVNKNRKNVGDSNKKVVSSKKNVDDLNKKVVSSKKNIGGLKKVVDNSEKKKVNSKKVVDNSEKKKVNSKKNVGDLDKKVVSSKKNIGDLKKVVDNSEKKKSIQRKM
jgi:hypothetical protein